jgi:hypothetical protein
MTVPRRAILLWSMTAILALASLAVAVAATTLFAQGWLCAFVFISMVPIGSLALLLIHGVTGGRWGADIAPVLVPAARTMPLLLVAVLPVLILRPLIYHWSAPSADVARFYLNPPFFDLRTLVALMIWSLFAWRSVWRKPLTAALALVVHLILVSLIPADWVMTIQPGSTSAGFGIGFGIEQIFAGLAFAALLAPQGADPRANRDLAGLLVTALLGTLYFDYMQFIVIWYGNIPDKVHWYIARTGAAWPQTAFVAFLAAAAIPFLGILNPAIRRSSRALQILGASTLLGIGLHVAWLTAPAFGAIVLLPALLGVATMGLVLAGGARRLAIMRHLHAQ